MDDDTTNYLALCAGFGSGKTYALFHKAIKMACNAVGGTICITQPTTPLLLTIVIPGLSAVLEEMGIPYTLYRSNNRRFVLHFESGDTTIALVSGENFQRIVGVQYSGILCDEIDTSKPEIAKAMVNKLIGRNRGKTNDGSNPRMAFTSTPESFGWLYTFFQKNAGPDRRLIRCSTYENVHNVGEAFIENMKSQYSPAMLQAYLFGHFVNLQSHTVYPNFDRETHHSDLKLWDIPLGSVLHIGVDFNVGQTCGIVSVVKDGKIIVIDEVVKQLDTPALIRTIKKRYAGYRITVYPDASGKNRSTTNTTRTDVELLKQAGFKVKVLAKNPPIKDRIATVQGHFMNGNDVIALLININTCPTLTETLETQAYDKNGLPEKTHDIDHPADALGYSIYYRNPIVRKGNKR